MFTYEKIDLSEHSNPDTVQLTQQLKQHLSETFSPSALDVVGAFVDLERAIPTDTICNYIAENWDLLEQHTAEVE